MTEEMEDRTPADHPKVAVHPPTVFFAALVLGYVIRVFAGGWLAIPHVLAEGLGGLMVALALGIAIAAISGFAEAGETLKPATPSEQLFVDGIFKRSRNPIYLAMVLFGIGFGIATLNLWIIATSLGAGVIFNFFVIPQEEDYLARRFGSAFEDYRRRVRRWL